MRKFLLSMVAVLLSTAINAQFINGTHNVLFSKAPGAKTVMNTPGIKKAKAGVSKVALESNQRVLGWYTTDEIDANGLGVNTNATLKLGVYIPSTMVSKFEGGKVVKIRFGLAAAATVNNVFLIPVTDAGIGNPVILQTLANPAVKGWNEVEIETPVELVTDGSTDYLMGYEYVQKTNAYPLGCHPTLGGMSFIYGNLGSGLSWYDMGEDYAFSVQAVVELDNIEAYHVILNDFYTDGMYAQAGVEMQYGLELENFGSEIPSDYTIDIALDGQVISTVQNPIELANEAKQYVGTLNLPEGIETGEHLLTASLVSVVGETPKNAYTKSTDIFVYQNSVERQKFLIEQATSHSCTYCPLGENVLSKLAKKCDVAWAAIHGNVQSTDPYYFADNGSWFNMVGLKGFPSAIFNRLVVEGELAPSIGYNADYADMAADYYAEYMNYFSAPAFATVNISTEYNDETKALNIKVSGDAVEDFKKIYGEDAVLTVYLTENGLVNRQLNQGRWVTKYNHEHVLRQYVTPYYGEQMVWNGNSYENDYNVTLNSTWVADNMNVIAFITRKIDVNNIDINKMDVNNAEIVKVGESITAGIDSAINEGGKAEVARYTIDGRKVGVPTKGLNIVKLNNGKTIKVVVK